MLDQTDPAEAGRHGRRAAAHRLDRARRRRAAGGDARPVDRERGAARALRPADPHRRRRGADPAVSDAHAADAANLIASMLTRRAWTAQAARWAAVVEQSGDGGPRLGDARGRRAAAGGRRRRRPARGLRRRRRQPGRHARRSCWSPRWPGSAGSDAEQAAPAPASGLGARRSLDAGRSTRRRASAQPGTVALLAGVGMQTGDWAGVPPHYLFRIVRALRAVGLDYEARMIAAEAMARL